MRTWLLSVCSVALVTALAQGCVMQNPTTISDEGLSSSDPAPGPGGQPPPETGTGTGTPTSPASDTGLPCEVAFLLAQRCRACHSNPPVSGASTSLMTYEDLLLPLPDDPTITVGEASLAWMRDAVSPMPPGQAPPAAEVDAFAAWVEAGMPATACATGDTGGTEPGPNPYEAAPTCTSESYWASGDEGSGDMLPGRACIACHSMVGGDEGPRFLFSGTVYPTAHEPDDCFGTGGAQIEITDATGRVITANARSSGNFYVGGDPAAELVMPITAKVIYDGKVLPMITPVDTGDCNACHTQEGKEGAPGRIILPW